MIQRPNCGNRRPFCPRGGQPMKCVEENAEHYVFACVPPGCGQVEVVIRPEHKHKLRERAMRERAGIQR